MTHLTPILRAWASLLGFLEADLATAVESMSRRLEVAMTAPSHTVVDGDMPDGYDGIGRHGELDHLLLSEWLLAQDEPLEFTRKLVMGELAFLHRERSDPQSPTRLVVLADSGPEQLGTPRLLHIAGLAVLARRAETLGVPLALGVLSDEPGSFRSAELPELFLGWLRSRSASVPSSAHVHDWLEALGPSDHVWVFSSSRLARTLPPGVRSLSAQEGGWTAEGPTHIDAEVDGRRLSVPLPSQADVVRLLRGQGIRRPGAAGVARTSGARFPRFTDHTRRLICRGALADELYTVKIPRAGSDLVVRPKRHRFSGPVVAAATFDTRIAALVWAEGSLKVEVIGRKIASLDAIDVMPSQFGLDLPALDTLIDWTLETMLFVAGDGSGALLLRIADRWWTIRPPSTVEEAEMVVAAAPSRILDQPYIARHFNDQLRVNAWSPAYLPVLKQVLLGPHGFVAAEVHQDDYEISMGTARTSVQVKRGEHVVGLTMGHANEPLLVVRSEAGHILRLQGPQTAHTLTAASGDLVDVVLHPTEPLLAVARRDGSIEAFDLPDGAPISLLVADAP